MLKEIVPVQETFEQVDLLKYLIDRVLCYPQFCVCKSFLYSLQRNLLHVTKISEFDWSAVIWLAPSVSLLLGMIFTIRHCFLWRFLIQEACSTCIKCL